MAAFEYQHIFKDLEDRDKFISILRSYFEEFFTPLGLVPSISKARLIDTYNAWHRDLFRVSQMELKGSVADHYKRAGYLAYWLRRNAPITMLVEDRSILVGAAPSEAKLNRAKRFANELTAFDVGWRLTTYFETRRADVMTTLQLLGRRPVSVAEFLLPDDFLQTICQFLKEKNVSPHALFLIYKALIIQTLRYS